MENMDYIHEALPAMHKGQLQVAVDLMTDECRDRPDLLLARFRNLLLQGHPAEDVTRLMSLVIQDIRP